MKIKDNFRAAQDFYSLVTEAHIVAAALVVYEMSSVDSEPSGIVVPEDPLTLKSFMEETVGKIVDKFVSGFFQSVDLGDTTSDGTTEHTQQDFVQNYASLVMGYGLMAENIHDACREGDGDRLARCWKFMLLHFRGNGRTKYAVEAVRFVNNTSALLSPRKAHQLKWNRMCNPKGGCGNNIPLDLQNEFINRVFKDNINTFLPNLTPHSVERSSQSLEKVHNTLSNLDSITQIHSDSGRHVLPNTSTDFTYVLQVLQSEQVFVQNVGRAHANFKKLEADPFIQSRTNIEGLHKWLTRHRKQASIEQKLTNKLLV